MKELLVSPHRVATKERMAGVAQRVRRGTVQCGAARRDEQYCYVSQSRKARKAFPTSNASFHVPLMPWDTCLALPKEEGQELPEQKDILSILYFGSISSLLLVLV